MLDAMTSGRVTTTPVGRRAPLLVAVLAGLLSPVGLAGCAGGPPTSDPAGVDGLVVPTPTPAPSDFVAVVDNPWFPLAPGTVWTYRSTADPTDRRSPGTGRPRGPQTDTVTVTHETRVVQGVKTVVVHDVATDRAGTVLEDTYDWYAQDTAGNVWYFGEDTTAYGAGRADTEGSWEAGVDGAEAGLVMPATPRVGDGYQQEHDDGVAEDRARILSLTEGHDVPAGAFDHLVQTEDTTPLEPGLVERKYYARGVGVVYEETVAGGDERVELLEVTRP